MKTIDFAGALGLTERSVTHHLEGNGTRTVVRMSRTFPTTVDDVWSATTDPERLQRWLGVATGNLAEGGVVTVRMTDDVKDTATLTILRCDAPRRLVVKWQWPDEPDSIVEMNLAVADGGETLLTIEHAALGGDLTLAYGAGWEDCLLRLAWLLDGGEPNGMDSTAFVEEITPIWRAAEADVIDDRRWPTAAPDGSGTVTLRARHEYAAAPDTVWAAITDHVRVSAWMAPVTGDLTVGGAWTIAYDNGAASGTVRECDPPRGFVTSWRWDFEPDAPESTVSVVLSSDGSGGTAVELAHERVTPPGTGYGAGWYAYMIGLDRYLAGTNPVEADWQADWSTAVAMIRP